MDWNSALEAMRDGQDRNAALEIIYQAVAPLCETPLDGLREWLAQGTYPDAHLTPADAAAEWDNITIYQED